MGHGRSTDAENAFRQALEIYSDLGYRDMVARMQSELASAYLARGNLSDSIRSAEATLGVLESADWYSVQVSNRLSMYLNCFHVLRAAHDPRARPLLERAYHELMVIADRLDETRRRSFLENVPHNREIIALWEAREAE
jgi:hypothetical protein